MKGLRTSPPRSIYIPRASVGDLSAQLEYGIEAHSDLRGVAIPRIGYLEIALVNNGFYGAPISYAISSLNPEEIPDCHHIDSGKCLPSITVKRGSRAASLHISGDREKRPCLEISGVSPACMLWATPGRPRAASSVNAPMSLKIHFPEPRDKMAMEEEARDVLSSLLYELDVRNGIRLRAARWPSPTPSRRTQTEEIFDTFARFPETRVNPEMATLFGFAGSAEENPPLSFLSYYQVLEFYFPAAVKRNALRQLGKELSDPRFSRTDKDALLKILRIGERSLNAAESGQLRTLLEECVRADRLEEFFTQGEWGDHFARNGPIRGVSVVNPKNSQQPLTSQVADRVYKIRNRIVHAKDDPRFDDVPALLPQSREADELWPDIALARFLASEVILDSQSGV